MAAGLIDIYDGTAAGAERAADGTKKLTNAVEGLGKAVASASFAPVPPPFGAIAPGGPVQVGTEGAPRLGTGGGGGAGGQFVTVGSPLVYSLDGGGPALTVEALEQFATKWELESGGWVYVFDGHLYPGSAGALSTMSAGGGGGSTRPGGAARDRFSSTTVGLADPGFGGRDGGRSGGGGTGGGRAAAASSAQPVVDELRGVNRRLDRLSRALEGDGGAALRFGGGL